MKKLLLAILSLSSTAFACAPYFPPSYLNGRNAFEEEINVPLELLYLAQEYQLIDDQIYTNSSITTAEADRSEVSKVAGGSSALIVPYCEFADKVRAGDTNAVPPKLPSTMDEFVLYTEGFREMQADSDLTQPQAWQQLMQRPATARKHRTTWIYYMLGNLASNHDNPDAAAKYYQACRQAARAGFTDMLGLAHASYKREQLAQTDRIKRIRCGVQAVAYYRLADDWENLQFCLAHLKKDLWKDVWEDDEAIRQISSDPLCMEAATLFLFRNENLIQLLEQTPPLRITPRLAWYLYTNGKIKTAEAYLRNCSQSDPLANWIRFRIAQRSGESAEAIVYLENWMKELQNSDRIIFSTYDQRASASTPSIITGNLGSLLVSQGDLLAALDCFIKAGSTQDAALIAERYLKTDSLKTYVDRFQKLPKDYERAPRNNWNSAHQSIEYVQYEISNLLARRLFREDRTKEAADYFAPEWADLLSDYLSAVAQSEDTKLSKNERAAHLFYAARILRWKGMELSGTELSPDYAITGCSFNTYGIRDEARAAGKEETATYNQNAPVPDVRFHYRHIAAQMAGNAALLAEDNHERAFILWAAGQFIQLQYPKEADVYYKQLARIPDQPLALAADVKRWFPEATPELESAFKSEQYLAPEELIRVAQNFTN